MNKEEIISIIFSCTSDLTKTYPAEAVRNLGLTYCSLLCLREIEIENSLRKCIRVLIFINKDNIKNHFKYEKN